MRQAMPADSKFAYQVKREAFREYVEQSGGWGQAKQRRLHARRQDGQH